MKQLVFSDTIESFDISFWIKAKLEQNEGYSIKLAPSVVKLSEGFVIITIILDQDA